MQIKLSKISLAVVATTLLLGSTSVLASNYKGEASYKDVPAAPCIQPLMLKDGFYVGAQVGYDSYNVGVTAATTVAGIGISTNPTMAANGFVGGILGGYGMYWNNFYYLGGELFVNGSAASQNQTTTVLVGTSGASVYSKFTVGTSWGISVLPGLKVNDSTLAYVRLGYNQANLKGQATVTSTVAGVTTSSYNSKTNWTGAFNYGVGLETAVAQNISVRGEYTHSSFNSFTTANGTKFRPSDNQFMAALIYHFS